MDSLPTELYAVAQVREFDRRAIEDLGIPGIRLMTRAGAAAYRVLRERWPGARRIKVLCGGGNNAGDGYVIADLARRDGLNAEAIWLADPARLRGDALTAAERYRKAGGLTRAFQPSAWDGADVVVDALFGTGLARPIEGIWREAVESVNRAGCHVLAVDVPSGLDAETGRLWGAAIHASATVTFIALKRGLFTGSGPAYTGPVVFDDLAVPAVVFDEQAPAARLITPARLGEALPPRPRDSHKGRFGHVLVVGGDHGMGGAARMAAEAALRVGAGLVSVATRSEHCAAILAARPEIMCRGVECAEELEPLLNRATVTVVGPGLGKEAWGRGLLERILAWGGPLVADADALNIMAANPPTSGRSWVLTPHPGEAARMLECSTSQVQSNRYEAALALHRKWGGCIVLKGAGTVVQAEGAPPWVCRAGNPGMASGGMGDVLSGVLGGLIAQIGDLNESAVDGVQVHAMAADLAAVDGERGLLATDLLPHLRRLVNPGLPVR